MSDAGLRGYIVNGSVPSIDKAYAMAMAGGVDFSWLCLGAGAGRRAPQMDGKGYVVRESAHPYSSPAETSEFTLVNSYAIEASAGHGSLVSDDVKTDPVSFRTDWLRKEGLEPARLAVIRARGDSMEPTISDGDVILVLLANGDSARDGLHVIRLDNGLFVKRLMFDPLGAVHVKSDNQVYPAVVITKEQREQMHIIGRVVWAGKKF